MHTLNNHLFVEVPEGFFNHSIVKNVLHAGDNRVKTSDRVGDAVYSERLPEGNYQILGLASSLTEDQWKGIVEMEKENVMIDWDVIEGDVMGNIYKDYCGDEIFYTPEESGQSFLKSKSLEAERTLVLKKI